MRLLEMERIVDVSFTMEKRIGKGVVSLPLCTLKSMMMDVEILTWQEGIFWIGGMGVSMIPASLYCHHGRKPIWRFSGNRFEGSKEKRFYCGSND